MKLNKFLLTSLMTGAFFGSVLFDAKSVSADTLCNGLPDGKECKLDADARSFTPGICKNQICEKSGTTMTTPTAAANGQITDTVIPGTTEPGGLIQCGRGGQNMCQLCDLIRGMNIIIQYLMKIAIGAALLMMTIGGAMYIVSVGDKNLAEMGKKAITNAAWGFVIIFAGWFIINTTINYIGAKTDAKGNATFGMRITSWGQFDCNARIR